MDNVYQLLAVYVFAATPCFAGWLANGGEREDVGVPIVGSILLTIVLLALVLFFA